MASTPPLDGQAPAGNEADAPSLDAALERLVRQAIAEEFRNFQGEILKIFKAERRAAGSEFSHTLRPQEGGETPVAGAVPTTRESEHSTAFSAVPSCLSPCADAVASMLNAAPLLSPCRGAGPAAQGLIPSITPRISHLSPKAVALGQANNNKAIPLFGRKQAKMNKYKQWLREDAEAGLEMPFLDNASERDDAGDDAALRLVAMAGTPRDDASLDNTLGERSEQGGEPTPVPTPHPHPLAPLDIAALDTKAVVKEPLKSPGAASEFSRDELYKSVRVNKKWWIARMAEELVRDRRFEYVSTLVILASAVHIGLQTNTMADRGLKEPPLGYRVADLFFLVFFCMELVARLTAFQLRYFYMPGWSWNVLDFVLIVGQILDEFISAIVQDTGGQGLSASLLRVVRLLRAARVFRVMHAVHIVEELRFLVICVMHSCRSFHWAAALIGMMVYVFGVYITQLVSNHQLEDGPNAELNQFFGSVPRSTLSLFQALTGGVDWDNLIVPLSVHISPWLGLLFVMYVAFAIVAVMNVITGTFVQHAMEGACHLDEVRKVRQAGALFKSLDSTHSGFITYDELSSHLDTPEVEAFFASVDLDVGEAKCLFEMLDVDNTGKVDFESFLGGCMRLQGPAKAIDVVLSLRALKDALEER